MHKQLSFFHFEKDAIQMEGHIRMCLVYFHSSTKELRITSVLM